MKTLWGEIRRGFLGVPRGQISYVRRGFFGATDQMQARLEQVGAIFRHGCHAALEQNSLAGLSAELMGVEAELRGFAFEGAAMGLALLDALSPWRPTRLRDFLHGSGDPHAYMVHVGVGFVWARFPFGLSRARAHLDPLLSWLAFDGWGFHEGFFHWPKYSAAQSGPSRLQGFERRVFDQGLGRSLWFVNGGNPELLARTVGGFPPERQGDLWSGLGLAATYAGIVDAEALAVLRDGAGPYQPQLAQGAAFAAKARQRAGNLTEYTELATGVLCDLPAGEAARLCDSTLENLPSDGPIPAYEVWRRRLQQHFQPAKELQQL